MFDRIRSWFETRRSGKTPLQQNMEKALHVKQEAGPQTNIPEHQTAHEGGVQGSRCTIRIQRSARSQPTRPISSAVTWPEAAMPDGPVKSGSRRHALERPN